MLLLVLLGLTAKLAFVSGDCNLGTPTLHDFDYSRYSGPRPWYFLKHHSDEIENNFDCVRSTFASPEGNRSLLNTDVYDISIQGLRAVRGNITNWNSTGYLEISHSLSPYLGRTIIIAIDYDRYFIGRHCPTEKHEVTVYVAYRSPHPDQETVNEVHREIQDKNLDASKLLDLSANYCPLVELSAQGGSSA